MEDNIDEIIDELNDLAQWEGCEYGDLARILIELWEGYLSYSRPEFVSAVSKEIIYMHNLLSNMKKDEEIKLICSLSNLTSEEKRKIALSKLSEDDKKILGL